jgi:hypothetical protein|tara:strand:- start:3885 stop:4406 length:522 start_codon:yes stop_codon:yes gene_type:complete
MSIYCVQTLVDVSDNGNLNQAFPFKTKSGYLVHDKDTLSLAKDQQQNFNTLVQSLQIRANITWDQHPVTTDIVTGNTKFGKIYEGKQKVWTFIFYTDQQDVYADADGHTSAGEKDLDLIPIVSFCKETATFPKNAFLTQDDDTRNTFILKVRNDEEDLQNRDIVGEILSKYDT